MEKQYIYKSFQCKFKLSEKNIYLLSEKSYLTFSMQN